MKKDDGFLSPLSRMFTKSKTSSKDEESVSLRLNNLEIRMSGFIDE